MMKDYSNKYGDVYVSRTLDCDVNEGGWYCQVYLDEDMTCQIDDFCIHSDDCDCTNDREVDAFITKYVEQYKDTEKESEPDYENE